MPSSAPSNADPIRLAAAQSHREARNPLIRAVLGLNLMPFGSWALLVTLRESTVENPFTRGRQAVRSDAQAIASRYRASSPRLEDARRGVAPCPSRRRWLGG